MKSYKIVRIAGLNYSFSMKEMLVAYPNFTSLTYQDQLKAIFDFSYQYSDSFTKVMKALGHNTHEIIYDCEIIQEKWLKENNIQVNSCNWQIEIILKQLEVIQPDILYMQDLLSLPSEIRKNIKKRIPSVKLVAVYKAFPSPINDVSDIDIFFLGYPKLIER